MNWKEILNLGYPQNILYVLGIENPSEDQIQGFYYTINSMILENINTEGRKHKYFYYLNYRFEECMTLQQIGDIYGVPRQTVDANIKSCLNKIRSHKNWFYTYYGYNKYIEMLRVEEEQKEQEQLEKEKRERRKKEIELHKIQKRDKDIHRKRVQRKLDKNDFSMNKDIKENGYFFSLKIIPQKAYEDLLVNYKDEISARLFNCIRRKFIMKYDSVLISDILEMIKSNPYWYKEVRNLGKETILELYKFLYNLGYLTKFELDYLSSFDGGTSKSYKPQEINTNVDIGYRYTNYIGKWRE